MSRIPIRIWLTLAFVLALGIVLAGLGVVRLHDLVRAGL